MTATDPNVASVETEAPRASKKVTLASVAALVVSLGGNVLQWQKNAAELAKTRAEVAGLQQQQEESATKSVQSWIEQLQKFDTVEDRVMVLSAAMSTTPYASVKTWAQEQMLRLEADLGKRKAEATEQLALATAPETDSVQKSQNHVTGRGEGVGRGGLGATGGGTGSPQTGPKPNGDVAAPAPLVLAQATAKKTLDRVNVAEAMLRAAKAAPAPVKPAP